MYFLLNPMWFDHENVTFFFIENTIPTSPDQTHKNPTCFIHRETCPTCLEQFTSFQEHRGANNPITQTGAIYTQKRSM